MTDYRSAVYVGNMDIAMMDNLVMLLSAIIGLLVSLFWYLENPRRGWLFPIGFFLTYILSSYYWTVYSLVIGDNPNVSGFLAYFGWNIGYVILLFLAMHIREEGCVGFFHPLILLPIPINLAQVALYLSFGSILNSIWQGFITTMVACYALQSLIYYYKNRNKGARFSRLNAVILLYIITQYGMWTFSCFYFDSNYLDPYYVAAFLNYFFLLMIPVALKWDYSSRGITPTEKKPEEKRFRILLQVMATLIILGFCSGGYFIATGMRDDVRPGADGSFGYIAITLFVISVILVLLILSFLILIALRFNDTERSISGSVEERRSGLNLVFIIAITLLLMIFSAGYTSSLFYRASLSSAARSGTDKVSSAVSEIKNYLSILENIPGEKKDLQRGEIPDAVKEHIKEVTEKIKVNGNGFGMVIDKDGNIISHSEEGLSGRPVREVYGPELFVFVTATGKGTHKAAVNGKKSTLFIDRIPDLWYVVAVVPDSDLYKDLQSQIIINIIVSLLIFFLITFFYFVGYKNEINYNHALEEFRKGKQEQEYRSQVLQLEKQAADEANKAKSSFLADMSHEIRTPINAILGMNEMIQRESKEKNIQEYSQNIGVSGGRLLQLINSILDFSKIEGGKMEIIPVRYSLKSVVTYLLNSVSDRALEKELKIKTEIEPSLPSELYGDDARISQVLMNLLTNAVKYTDEGSVTLRMKEMERKDNKVLIRAEVEDTGPGIRESDMDRLFASFERLDTQKNRNIEGTGLGLSISSRLLSLMESELQVESSFGEGSRFYFDLWQDIEDPEPIGDYALIPVDTKGMLEEEYSTFRAPAARILVVDDTKMNLMVVRSLLKRTEMKIDVVISGEDAIKLAKRYVYDVILLDQRMPGLSGVETLKEIRTDTKTLNRDTPVVCLTADAIRGARERYISEGFTDYLTKPVSGHDLEETVLRYIPEDKVIEEVVPGILEGDDEMYREVMSEFVSDSVSRRERLINAFETKNLENYAIDIHALKSSAKIIGERKLANLAEDLEEAAKNGDISFLEGNHPALLTIYAEAVASVKDKTG